MTNKKLIQSLIIILALLSLNLSAPVTINKLDGISSTNLVYSGYLPISDSSSDQLFFTYYSCKDAKQ
jgi:carboxypeptidase C (cathepsin A)